MTPTHPPPTLMKRGGTGPDTLPASAHYQAEDSKSLWKHSIQMTIQENPSDDHHLHPLNLKMLEPQSSFNSNLKLPPPATQEHHAKMPELALPSQYGQIPYSFLSCFSQ